MPEERRVHLFRHGRNQALRIPREWELDADEALLRREDGVLTVVPVPRIVVTGNVREFRRVAGLGVEDWREALETASSDV